MLREDKASLILTKGDLDRAFETKQDQLVSLHYGTIHDNEGYDQMRRKEITLDLQIKDNKRLNKELNESIGMETTKHHQTKDARLILEREVQNIRDLLTQVEIQE